MRRALAALVLACAACGGAGGGARGGASSGGASPGEPAGGEVVEEKVVYEKLPDGRVKKTTIRTVRRVVPAEPPPPRPADPYPADPLVKYNVERINAYRARLGLPPVLYDAKISAFAREGSARLAKDHAPHAHFRERAQGAPGFGSRSAENQGDPAGVPSMDADREKSGKKQIDVMLKMMMDEGPGGGHYDNMTNPKYRRVGIGLVYEGGRLYMTNDFSD